MRSMSFARRNVLELLRDPINLGFGLGFPLLLILLLSAIQANIPVSLFEIGHLTPGIAVFGLSFVTLFSATLIAKDRGTSLMMRLFASPLTAGEFITSYTLPMLPLCLGQSIVCFLAAMCLGLKFTGNILMVLVTLLPAAVFFISLGLLFGSILNDKQVGGICGALLTNLSAWLSGTWFDIELVGGAFKKVAYALPFVHAVNAGRAALSGDFAAIFPDLWWVIGYAVVMSVVAVIVFGRKMRSGNV